MRRRGHRFLDSSPFEESRHRLGSVGSASRCFARLQHPCARSCAIRSASSYPAVRKVRHEATAPTLPEVPLCRTSSAALFRQSGVVVSLPRVCARLGRVRGTCGTRRTPSHGPFLNEYIRLAVSFTPGARPASVVIATAGLSCVLRSSVAMGAGWGKGICIVLTNSACGKQWQVGSRNWG